MQKNYLETGKFMIFFIVIVEIYYCLGLFLCWGRWKKDFIFDVLIHLLSTDANFHFCELLLENHLGGSIYQTFFNIVEAYEQKIIICYFSYQMYYQHSALGLIIHLKWIMSCKIWYYFKERHEPPPLLKNNINIKTEEN